MKVPFMNVMNLRYTLAWIVIKMQANLYSDLRAYEQGYDVLEHMQHVGRAHSTNCQICL